jgi:DNA topoisomerase-1
VGASNLVIVESPAKAKTINKYLGNDYKVLASFGHVRDLPPKDGSVKPDEGFEMAWEVSDRGKKTLKEITTALKDANTLILATDPDREGEAIAWHVREFLDGKKALKDKTVKRVTFNEITKNAVQAAFDNARDLDTNLVEAYLARRALDYLVGFTLSPVLWRKLPGSRSAGRVQSVALRLICEREDEIEKFNSQEYWSIETLMKNKDGARFNARLTHLAGNKLDKLDLSNEEMAQNAVKRIEAKELKVTSVEKKQIKRHPAAPFITSTLQQEAARKLGFSATQTMRTAQKLYEGIDIKGETVGLITYMRTDGITLSGDAIAQARDVIGKTYGEKYVPNSPRAYKSKAKNAQEAHEAIRPTNLSRDPESLKHVLDDAEFKLYTLIWKRTIACQMESTTLDQVRVDLSDGTDDVVLRANGSVIAFDGFLKLYREGFDDKAEQYNDRAENDSDKILPPLEEGDNVKTLDIMPEQHFTQPPPRFTEASLVKAMEELGIGRPSTYASILQVLRDRDYVVLDQKRFIPEDRGRIVVAFLKNFFSRYVEYDFTAEMEEELDSISAGNVQWKAVLELFWKNFKAAIDGTKDLTITQVIDALNADLEAHFFTDGRKCPNCDDGELSLKLGKFGAFVGCSNYPECNYTRKLEVPKEGDSDGRSAALDAGPIELGKNEDGLEVSLRKGPYGVYVQLDPDPNDIPEPEIGKNGKPKKVKMPKPKRQGLPKGLNPDDVDLEKALELLSLPRVVGKHPDDGEIVDAGIGRFGPFVRHQGKYKSVPADEDVLTIGLNRAVELIAQAGQGRGGASAKPLKELGKHPDDGEDIAVYTGRYGPYVKHKKTMASLPKDVQPEQTTLEMALELLEKKAKAPKKKKAPAKKKKS